MRFCTKKKGKIIEVGEKFEKIGTFFQKGIDKTKNVW